jgi:hypothetical protein
MRGRGRKGPNPLTRTYESNGPDVKIRGTAMHIAEKYQQLARDAQASGDRVMSENYNQHAEHYLRIVAAAQPQQQPSARAEAEDGYDGAPQSGNGHANGSDRQTQDASSGDGDLMDADSPQPFIDDMPVIDQEGKVNGAGQKADSTDDADDKPRRRGRPARTRTPRRAAGEGDASADGASEASDAVNGSDGDDAKPRRRTARPRRKAGDEVPAEAATASE